MKMVKSVKVIKKHLSKNVWPMILHATNDTRNVIQMVVDPNFECVYYALWYMYKWTLVNF